MPETPDSLPPASQPMQGPVLALIRDLMFSSRVTSTAAQLKVTVKLLRDPAMLAGESGRKLIVDLNLPGAIEAAAAWKQAGGGARKGEERRGERSEGGGEERTVAGFVSHVDAETIHRARSAGIDRVVARSQFVQILADLLR